MKKNLFAALLLAAVGASSGFSQALRIPETTNTVCMTGRKVGVTEI